MGRKHRGDRICVGIELSVPIRGGDIHGPVACAAYIGGTALFENLVSANLVAEIVPFPILGDDFVAELIVQALGRKVALFLGYPLLQPHMGRYDELGHANLLQALFVHCSPRSLWGTRALQGQPETSD
jgi:hypothetical protein